MSDEMEQFERRLKNQPLRQAPAEWRWEILSAVREAQRERPQQSVVGHSFLSSLNQRLASLLWPHPVAWGGLAAVWIFIGALHLSMRVETPAMAEKTLPPSPEAVVELRQQQHLFAELMGANDLPVADRQKPYVPKPRSENVGILTA
jgi:hypothetical protein